MDKILIRGGIRLKGEVEISGAKNAAVAILPAALLADGVTRIENIPNISDITAIVEILRNLGAQVFLVDKHTLEIDSKGVRPIDIPYELTKNLRASYYFLGVLLARFHRARVSMPGGCNFGVRPIDQHVKGFEALGANVSIEHGMIDVNCPDGLIGNQIYFDGVTVGATINVMLAAVKAKGLTVIENAAKEPHVVDLANFLNSMGADIRGAGTDVIKIRGVDILRGTTYTIIPDQIEAGTYMMAAAATGGDVLIKNIIPKHLESITAKLVEMGVDVEEYDDSIRVSRSGPMYKCNVKTLPHPGFPTDMQPQITVLLCLAEGTSIVSESIWENRFKYVDELTRMGAQIQVDGKVAVVTGVGHLAAAPIKVTDLRAGAAMVIAGLVAEGQTQLEEISHIERGYEDIEQKLKALGADIHKIHVETPAVSKAL